MDPARANGSSVADPHDGMDGDLLISQRPEHLDGLPHQHQVLSRIDRPPRSLQPEDIRHQHDPGQQQDSLHRSPPEPVSKLDHMALPS